MNKPTEDEINEVIDWTYDNDGKYWGMSYEQGLQDALLWILGDAGCPIADEEEND